jgi:6-phosphogluconolactonase (cycloisomerase 2 family)
MSVKACAQRWLPLFCLVIALTGCGGGGSPECRSSGSEVTTTTAQYVFVANLLDGSVSPYKLGPTGTLAGSSAVKLAKTLPYDLTYDPKHQRLFALGPYSVSVLSVTNEGSITEVAGSPLWIGEPTPAADAPPTINAIAVHPAGDFLFVAEEGVISTYRVVGTGTPLTKASEVQYSAFALNYPGGALQIDPAGKYLYALTSGAEAKIGVFTINTTNGALTPIMGSPFPIEGEAGAMAMHPAGKLLYLWNLGPNSDRYVQVFNLNQTTGAVTPAIGSPFPTVTYPGQIIFSGDLAFMLAEQQVTSYSVASSGGLTYVNSLNVSTMMGAAEMAVDAAGKFFFITDGYPYGSGLDGNTVAVFSIGANGSLTQIGSKVPTGSTPQGVLVVSITTSEPSTCTSIPGTTEGRGH